MIATVAMIAEASPGGGRSVGVLADATLAGIGPASTLFWTLIAATLAVAVADWVAVALDRRPA